MESGRSSTDSFHGERADVQELQELVRAVCQALICRRYGFSDRSLLNVGDRAVFDHSLLELKRVSDDSQTSLLTCVKNWATL